MRIPRLGRVIIVPALLTAPLLAACGAFPQTPSTIALPSTSATFSPATSTRPPVSTPPLEAELPTVTETSTATVTSSAPTSARPPAELAYPPSQDAGFSTPPGFPDPPNEDPGPYREWALYGPHTDAQDCQQARERWPDLTSECFAVDGETYFYGMRQPTP